MNTLTRWLFETWRLIYPKEEARRVIVNNWLFVGVTATRTLGGIESRQHRYYQVKVYIDGPNKAMERLAVELSNEFTTDWTYELMQLSEFEYKAGVRRLEQVDA